MHRRVITGLATLAALAGAFLALRGRPGAGAATPAPRPLLLIVAPAGLDEAAAAWAEHRTRSGWSVDRLAATDSAEALRDAIRTRARAGLHAGAPRVAVLLLGDASPDGVPTFRFEQPDPRLVDPDDPCFASDHPYQLLDDRDELPDIALGRVPVSSNESALAVLEKVRRYEGQPAPGAAAAWRYRVNFVAGEGRFGLGDALMESMFRTMVDTMVPESFDISMTFASPTSVYCPPPSAMERTISDRLREGSLLFNYLGHGAWHELDRMRWAGRPVPLLRRDAAAALEAPSAALPVAFLGCCSAGWFDREDGADSLAEALLTAPGGPVAVIAGSRPTHPYGTAVLQKDLVRGLLQRRTPTVGELDLLATRSLLEQDSDDAAIDLIVRPVATLMRWPCSLAQLRLMHVRLYNLLGDPATRLAHPPPPPSSLEVVDGRLRGSVAGLARGTVEVVVETARDAWAGAPLSPPSGRADPALERIAAENYPRANERTLCRVYGEARNGAFEVELPDLPPQAALLRCIVSGEDAAGSPLAAVGGLRLGRGS